MRIFRVEAGPSCPRVTDFFRGLPAASLLRSGGPARGFLLCSLAGDPADVLAIDAEIGQFAVVHAVQFADRLTILHPVVEAMCHAHIISPFV